MENSETADEVSFNIFVFSWDIYAHGGDFILHTYNIVTVIAFKIAPSFFDGFKFITILWRNSILVVTCEH